MEQTILYTRRNMGIRVCRPGGEKGATFGIWVLPLAFCRTLDNFINPSGPLLIKRIIFYCRTCPPHLEMVRGLSYERGYVEMGSSVLWAARRNVALAVPDWGHLALA